MKTKLTVPYATTRFDPSFEHPDGTPLPIRVSRLNLSCDYQNREVIKAEIEGYLTTDHDCLMLDIEADADVVVLGSDGRKYHLVPVDESKEG